MTQIGYCTNVHSGTTLAEVKANLDRYAIRVRNSFGPGAWLNVGLWLSETAARSLESNESQKEFGEWLEARRLFPFTFNGFPYGDFHQEVVKLDVYEPTWAEQSRLDYTIRLAEILSVILPDSTEATISTLPLGWPVSGQRSEFLEHCAKNLIVLSDKLRKIDETTGRKIMVCLEPEPGCVFDTAPDIAAFFDQQLSIAARGDHRFREYLGVCHDVCHSAVMFEPQRIAIETYQNSGITIGKVQVSSAVEIDFDSLGKEDKTAALDQLQQFAEPKYMHQTSIQRAENEIRFFTDLPEACENLASDISGLCRVHFHVPIFESSFGLIGSTQAAIVDLVRELKLKNLEPQFEIETYAWGVLPEHLQKEGLANSLIREVQWFQKLYDSTY